MSEFGDSQSGYEEIPHTADWALRVWAPSLPELFGLAARGMYALMEVSFADGPRHEELMAFDRYDAESQLVEFLTELLYSQETDGIGFTEFAFDFIPGVLVAHLAGAPISEQRKEIKAVTFHNLAIRQKNGLYDVTIVFDV